MLYNLKWKDIPVVTKCILAVNIVAVLAFSLLLM